VLFITQNLSLVEQADHILFLKEALSVRREPTSSSWKIMGATAPWFRLLQLLQNDTLLGIAYYLYLHFLLSLRWTWEQRSYQSCRVDSSC
jgi:hypothetical protein